MSGESSAESPNPAEWVRRATLDACLELFASPTHPVRRADGVATNVNYQIVSLIGFTGPAMRGMMGIAGPTSLFEHSHPSAGRKEPLTRNDVCDWASELANRLLGRATNTVSAQGLDLALSTPSVLTGDLLEIFQSGRPSFERFAFYLGETPFYVCLEIQLIGAGPNVAELAARKAKAAAASPEGDVILF